MPATSQEDQFKFLISCIRYSNNGKIDFAEVAKECGIVSKGAAAKRYERMMKFHGLHQPASALRETFKSADPKEDKSSAPITPVKRATEDPAQSSPSPKKRSRKSVKGIDGENRNLAMDDDEELAAVGAAKIKIEKIEKKNPPTVKEEPQAGYHGLTGYQYPLAEEGAGTNGEEYGDVLSDFLRPEDFETQHESDGNAYVGYGH